ncbi:MAG: hypothetical protein WCV62_05935 [Candidatus Peribacteraceae bacterium]|jgi:hypothetical protein
MGLSQTVQLTRLGKIHLGIKKASSKNAECKKKNHPSEPICMYCSYPVQTDYFVFGGPGDYPPGIHEALVKEYGEKPKSLQFYFPTENRALVFPHALKFYKGPRLWCRGDNQTATRIDEKTGGQFSVNCPCEHLGAGCAPRASLMIALYKVKVSGVFQLDTGSIHNIIRTNSFMNEIAGDPAHPETTHQSLLRRISYVPLTLSLIPQQIMTPGPEGKAVTKPLWVFTFDGDGRQAAMLRQRDAISALLPGQPEMAALPPAPDDRRDDVRDATGPTLDGKPLTPPDEAIEGDVIDGETGEVLQEAVKDAPGPEPDPKAPPYDRSVPVEAPAQGEVPFPEAEKPAAEGTPPPPPTYPWTNKLPQDAGSIVQTVNAIKSRDEFDAFKAAIEPILAEKVKPGMRKAVENVITEKQAELY